MDGKTVSNPMPSSYKDSNGNDIDNEIGENVLIDEKGLKDFFAKDYLADEKYETRVQDGLLYVYFKFKDSQSAASYVNDIASGSKEVPASLKKLLNKYTASLFENTGSVKIENKGDAKFYTNGTLLTIDNTGVGKNQHDNLGNYGELIMTSMDLSNRYLILTQLLADIPWEIKSNVGMEKYIVSDPEQTLFNLKNHFAEPGDLSSAIIFNKIIDTNQLTLKEYNSDNKIVYGQSNEKYIKVAVNGDFAIDSKLDVVGGVVVATGNVTVSANFEGLIIAGGTINVVSGVTVTSNPTLVEELITNEQVFEDGHIETYAFRQYFHAYKFIDLKPDKEEVNINKLNYKDIVKVNNWRKYEDIKK